MPVELNSDVEEFDRGGDERFRLEVGGRASAADQIVVATGPFQTPYVPKLNEKLSSDLFQTHAVGYRKPGAVPTGTVLVVGGGNTGFQIAKELSATHRSCSRSARSKSRYPSACSGETSSGGSPRRAYSTRRSTRASAAG